MKIETKFNIGDEVWGIQMQQKRGVGPFAWATAREGQPLTVGTIRCRITRADSDIVYVTRQGQLSEWAESDLFPTAAEAQAACDKRNAEAKP